MIGGISVSDVMIRLIKPDGPYCYHYQRCFSLAELETTFLCRMEV